MTVHRAGTWMRVAYGVLALGLGALAWRSAGEAPEVLKESWAVLLARTDDMAKESTNLGIALGESGEGNGGKVRNKDLAKRMQSLSTHTEELLHIPAVRSRLSDAGALDLMVARVAEGGAALKSQTSSTGQYSRHSRNVGDLKEVLLRVRGAAAQAEAEGEPAPQGATGPSPEEGQEDLRRFVLIATLAFVFAVFGLVAVQSMRSRTVPRFLQEVFTSSASFLIGAASSAWMSG